MTNADKIRQMSDEELAIICEDGCPPNANCVTDLNELGMKANCIRCWLDWLRKEANDE